MRISVLRFPRVRPFAPLLALALAAGCSDSDPSGPVDEPFQSLTVDASSDWTYVRLAETASQVQVTDPASSTAWDLAFFATGVSLNGGAAGPGEVQGYCLCQNEAATDQQVIAMSDESERPAFEAVTVADIPTDEEAWQSDALDPAIDGWWSYDMATHTVTPATDRAWIVRTAEGDAFAKLRVVSFEGATQQNAGRVTLEFALQNEAGDGYGATRSVTADLSSGPAYVDLVEGSIGDQDDWDLRLEGYTMQINGGVSGSGNAAAVDAGASFDDAPPASEIPERIFASDDFGGVFEEHPWYRYDLQGNHQIWPTYNVYLIRKGSEVYKVQITSYYRPSDGEDRHITFRYAPVTE